MAGPSIAPYIIPVGAFLALSFWLAMIFWADRHPAHGGTSEQFRNINPPEDWQVEMGVPPQRTAVDEAGAEKAAHVPAQSAPDRDRITHSS